MNEKLIKSEKRKEKINKLSEKQDKFKCFTIDPNMQRKSLRDIHNLETFGHTKKDRACSIWFYRVCCAVYFVFLVCTVALLILVDLIPKISSEVYIHNCIFTGIHFIIINFFMGIICLQHLVKILFYIWLIKQWKNKKINPINNL